MMMNCEKIQTHIAQFAAGDLPAAVRDQILVHLDTCQECQQELALEYELCQQMADLPLVACPDHVTRDILAEIEADDRRNSPGNQRYWWVGASGLVAAALALIMLLPGTHSPPSNSYSNEEIRLATSEAQLALAKVVTVINQQEQSAFKQVFGTEIPDAVGGSLIQITKTLQGEV